MKGSHAAATLCSLALLLWGYQTGAWTLAIPMVLALESRHLLKLRWTMSWQSFRLVHVLGSFLWLFAIFQVPMTSPSPIPYATGYHLLKCLPVGFFPFILSQTFFPNFTSFYRGMLPQSVGLSRKPLSLYYPYFGICLLAASATGGNIGLFLALAAGLTAGFLGSLRSPRFSPLTFYGLMGLALIVSLMGTHHFYWLQANVKLKNPVSLTALLQNVAALTAKADRPFQAEPFNSDLRPQIEPQAEPAPGLALQPSPQIAQSPDIPPAIATAPSLTPPRPEPGAAPSATPAPSTEPSGPETQPTPASGDRDPGAGDSDPNNEPVNAATPPVASSSPEGSDEVSATLPEISPSANPSASTNRTTLPQSPASQPGAAQQQSGSNHQQSGSNRQQTGGNVDPNQSATQIGNSGSLQPSDAILFRVAPVFDRTSNRPAPKVPLYIREATYNQYRSGTWNAVAPKFVTQAPQGKQRWRLGPQTAGTTAVRISTRRSQGTGILTLPVGTSGIDPLAVDALQMNQYGTVTVQGQPGDITYTVEFDPTRTFDSSPTPDDRAVPPAEQPTMQAILTSLNLKGKSDSETVQAISAFFKKGFQYSLTLPSSQTDTQTDRTPLSAFLLNHRSGHCEYFASATSLLLRSAGIPARYAVGYAVHEYSPGEQQYIVRARNAHAWVMAYVNGRWITVETTPGGGLAPSGGPAPSGSRPTVEPAMADDRTPSSTGDVQPAGEDSAAPAGDAVPVEKPPQGHGAQNNSTRESFLETLKSCWKSLTNAGSWLWSQLTQNLSAWFWPVTIMALGLTTILASIFWVWRMGRKPADRRSRWRRGKGFPAPRSPLADGLDSEFYLIEQQLGDWGLERQASETVRQWLLRLKQQLPESSMKTLQQIIDLHYRYRFDPQGLAQEERTQLRTMIHSWLTEAPP